MGKKDNDFVMTMLCRVVDPPRKERRSMKIAKLLVSSVHLTTMAKNVWLAEGKRYLPLHGRSDVENKLPLSFDL
jgi:hypothetical protein